MRAMIVLVVAAACGGESTPALPAWQKDLPASSAVGTAWQARGLTTARGIVHLHSPYSHDACDGKPRDANGTPDERCLQDLRAAMCTTRIDFAALTDHDDSMADEDFATLLSMRGTDERVGSASRIRCANGHEVLVTVGSENDLMPIMLDRHVDGTPQERHDLYNRNDATAAAAFRAASGLVWIAHTESKDLATLRAVAPDGIEVYNLHANIDPDIRRDYLGLSSTGALSAAAEFADTNPGHPEPDLALLAFLSPNRPAIDTWNTLLGEGRRVAASAGSDAHQNAIPVAFADGERGDSYRRVLRWFANFVITPSSADPSEIERGLRDGRVFTAVEMLGTPVGFDAHVEDPSGAIHEIGSTVPPNSRLVVTVPRLAQYDQRLPAPVIRTRVYRIAPGGNVTELTSTTNDNIVLDLGAPGAYRIEISMVPHHLAGYLGDLGPALAQAELPWIYVSPFYVP
ncbi:MAG TPA: hypothetical protein VK427_16260 [Kofleriaceae bacterium]|nr:hypothetical protein [Kofleriaceae bacterium]